MLLFSYAKSGKLNESENKMRRVHAKGRGFSCDLFAFRAIPDAQRKNKQFKRKETPFFMPLILRITAFMLRQGSRKLFYRVGSD
jgi:hypothetical protein